MYNASDAVKAEYLAGEYLKGLGYCIIDKNVSFPGRGEIDIVASDGGVTVFVEVKYRSTPEMGDAAEAVDAAKRRKLLKAAEAYIDRRGLYDTDVRFDVVAVRDGAIEHIKNAFYGYWN